MSNLNLWEGLSKLKESCDWIDLSHEVSPETPHWFGFPSMKSSIMYDFAKDGFRAHSYEIVSQYGTHVDAPVHFVEGMRCLDTFKPIDMVMPLCVVDLSAKVAENSDFIVTKEDILAWEEVNGKIPEGAFVAFRSDWYKKGSQAAMENKDAEGKNHYPGWGVPVLEFLVNERNIGAIGHEQADTDPSIISGEKGMVAEYYILSTGRFQIEMMRNLDLCPATGAVIFCTFPKVKDGTGFTARCFAVCPK